MKTKLLSLSLLISMAIANAQTFFTENFNDILTLTSWTQTNQSSTVGPTGWFQGNDGVFPAQAGPATSYIGANFASVTGSGTISNWLITPQVLLKNGDIIKFWTSATTASAYPDRLEVRLSTGSTFTSPVGATGVGSFSTLLTSVNGPLTVGGYPEQWTEVSITISGLSTTTTPTNIGLRYFVTDGGIDGTNSDYIGIDTFTISRTALAVSDAGKTKVSIYPNPTSDYLKINTASKINSVEIFDISGKKVPSELVGNTLDVQKLAKGSYVLKINAAEGSTSQKFIKK